MVDMETSSPQGPTLSRQTKSARETGRPLKLRSSCDTCANSKVKCDRQRPACQRCLNAGAWCNYSVSRRMGKPAGSGQRGSSKTEAKVQNGRSSMRTPSVPANPERDALGTVLDDMTISQNFPGQFAADVGSSVLGFDHATSMPWMNFNLMSDGCGYPSSHPSEILLSTPTLLPFNDSMGFCDNWAPTDQGVYSNRIGSWGSSSHLSGSDIDVKPPCDTLVGQAYPSWSPTHLSYTPQTSPENRRTDTCNGITSCSDLAFTIIQSLHAPSNICTTSNSKATSPAAFSTVDQLLTTNRRAISSFDTLLQCPCSGNSSFALTLALIILKILSCYNAAARCYSPYRTPSLSSLPSPFPSSSSSGSYCDKDAGMAQDTVFETPVMMAPYQMDAEEGHHLQLQLFLSELRKVSKLVDAFAERYCKNWAEKGMGNRNADDGLYSALETLLRKEWRNAVKEVVTFLRSCENGVMASVE